VIRSRLPQMSAIFRKVAALIRRLVATPGLASELSLVRRGELADNRITPFGEAQSPRLSAHLGAFPVSNPRGLMKVATLALAMLLFIPSVARAHRDDYLDETFVYVTLGRHEFEVETWAEARRGTDHRTVGWYTGAFEYGVSSHWMVDAAAQALHKGDGFQFGRLRLESRARFAEEGRWPVDVAASTELWKRTKASMTRSTLPDRRARCRASITARGNSAGASPIIPGERSTPTTKAAGNAARRSGHSEPTPVPTSRTLATWPPRSSSTRRAAAFLRIGAHNSL
jgi:hypothetical protein